MAAVGPVFSARIGARGVVKGKGKVMKMNKSKPGHFEILQGIARDVVAVSASGHISGHDYEAVLIPLVEEGIRREGKIKLLYVIGPEFEGFSAGAAWDDTKLGLLHMRSMARIAVVSDLQWVRLGMKAFAPMIPCPVRVFHVAELDAAKAWIAKDDAEKSPKPEVAASHKIPPLEDMIPPPD